MTVAFLLTMFQIMAQNRIWTFPNMQLQMANNALPIVSAINGGVPLTTINNYNAMQDDNGNLLFYIVDNILFDNNSNIVAEMKSSIFNGTNDENTYGFPEMPIIPANDNPDCNTFFIVGGAVNEKSLGQGSGVGGISPQWYIYNSTTLQLTGSSTYTCANNNVCVMGNPIAGSSWTTTNSNNHLLTLNYAVTQRNCNNNNRILYIFNGLELNYCTVTGAGISFATLIPSTFFTNLSSQFESEMETVTLADGTILLAFYSSNQSQGSLLNIYHFQADGFTQITENHYTNVFVNGNFHPVGFEFSPSGKYLYYTCKYGNTINYFDVNAGTEHTMPVNGINQTDYAHSQIEMAKDGRLYFVRNAPGNLLLTTFNTPENPTSNNWTLNAVPAINFAFPTGYRDIGILPDQQDGENYDTKGIVVSKPTITQTPDVPLCADQYNTATLTANTTCPPLSYAWNTGAATSAINVNLAGTYTVTVTYQCGYTASATQQVYNCCNGTFRIDGPYEKLSDLVLNNNIGFLTTVGSNAYMTNVFDCSNPADPHQTLAINGRLIVDMNLELQGMEILLGPNSEIVVKNGFLLKNNGPSQPQICNYLHGCDEYMWQGIILEGSTANNDALQFKIMPVYIEDAKQAIRADNNAKFTVNNVLFNKNNVSMHVTPNGNLANNSTITNCKIQCNTWSSYTPQTCLQPYLGKRSYGGVKANNILSMTIGDEFNLNNKNYFRNQDTGIVVINSAADIYNNAFLDATLNDPLDQGLENGIGVSAVGSKIKTSTINIGKNGIGANSFSNLWCGVRSKLFTEQHIQFNTSTGIGYGIFISSHRNMKIEINNNTMQNFYAGIFGGDMVTADYCKVHSNNLYQNFASGFVGIRLGSSLDRFLDCEIYDNTIASCRYGINVLNTARARINNNTINITVTPNTNMAEHVGIRGQNITTADAVSNTINWLTHPTSTNDMINYATKVKGLQFNTCANGSISFNHTHWCGAGFEAIFNCPQLEFTCNDNNDCFNGFYLTGATLPNMIKLNGNDAANANTWNNNISQFNIDWPMFNPPNIIDWYYVQAITNSEPFPRDPLIVKPKIISNGVDCSNIPDGGLANTVERIINDSINYESFTEENRFAEDEFAYDRLQKDSALAATIDSVLAHQFRYAMDSNTIGQFYQVQQAIANEDYASAYNLNAQISDSRMVAVNKQIVNEIYLRTIALDKPLEAEDKITLMDIATLLSLAGGEGTFWAREILGVDFEDLLSSYLRTTQTTVYNDNLNAQVKLMPNPTNGKVILNASLPINSVTLYNSMQQEVTTPQLLMDDKNMELDLSAMDNGVFYVKVVFATQVKYYTVVVTH